MADQVYLTSFIYLTIIMMIDGALEIACTGLIATGFILAVTVFQSDQWQASDTGTVFTQATTRVRHITRVDNIM